MSLRRSSSCTITLFLACLLGAPPLAAREAQESLTERLHADAASGVLDRDEAAVYAHMALFAPDQLPARYKSLSVEAPRCATGLVRAAKDAATRVAPELRAAFEAARPPAACTGEFPFSLRSSVYPMIVHYLDADLAAEAANMLRFAEESWDLQVGAMGQTAPLLDGGACGPDENLDLYLLRGIGYAFVESVTNNPATPYDDWSTYMVLDPNVWGGVFLETIVAHEFQHVLQGADDWWEINLHEAASTFIEDVTDDDFDFYFGTLAHFARSPHQPLEFDDNYRSNFFYGMAQYFFFLRDRYFGGDPSFLADFWRNARSPERGCYCTPVLNEPDFLDSIDVLLGALGPISALDSIVEFSRWRWFVSTQDDGAHFEEGGLWPTRALVPIHARVATAALPARLDVPDGPMTNGVVYVAANVSSATSDLLQVEFSGEARYDWHVEALRDLPGKTDIWIPGTREARETFRVDLAGSKRVVLKVLNLAFDGYDPDFLDNRRTQFSLDLALVVDPSKTKLDIRPGSDVNPIHPRVRGVVPVAILGAEGFAVEDVDVTTVAFGPAAAAPLPMGSGRPVHVNADGFPDLLLHFATQETGLATGDHEACVAGELFDGRLFESCDSVSIVPGGRGALRRFRRY